MFIMHQLRLTITTFALACFTLMVAFASPALANEDYQYDIIAQTGKDGLSDIFFGNTSINDYGLVAFSGRAGGAYVVRAGDASGAARTLASDVPSFASVSSQINNKNQVVTRRIVTSTSLPQYYGLLT